MTLDNPLPSPEDARKLSGGFERSSIGWVAGLEFVCVFGHDGFTGKLVLVPPE